jgi:hypothetical protein
MTFRRRGFGRLCLAASAAMLIVVPVALSAQSDDRRRAVGDWLIEDAFDDAGGRTLRMVREDGDYSLDYHINMSPAAGNFESQGFMVWRLTCGQGGEESLDGGPAAVQARAVRARIADYLARCETPAAEAQALLGEFDRAFAVLAEWSATVPDSMMTPENAIEAAAAAAENAAMSAEHVDGGDMDMSMDMNATDMDMVTDVNMTGWNMSEDAWTNSVETDEPK